jgi:hypothetical protein
MQLIESEKIKNNILNFELDLWIDWEKKSKNHSTIKTLFYVLI